MMRLKFTTLLNFSIYFFRKSKRPERSALGVQKSSWLSNRFAFKGVRRDII